MFEDRRNISMCINSDEGCVCIKLIQNNTVKPTYVKRNASDKVQSHKEVNKCITIPSYRIN